MCQVGSRRSAAVGAGAGQGRHAPVHSPTRAAQTGGRQPACVALRERPHYHPPSPACGGTCRQLEAEAQERSRKFQLMQRSFKADLDAAREQLEGMQVRAGRLRACVALSFVGGKGGGEGVMQAHSFLRLFFVVADAAASRSRQQLANAAWQEDDGGRWCRGAGGCTTGAPSGVHCGRQGGGVQGASEATDTV